MRYFEPQPLTAESFRPFGRVMQPLVSGPTKSGEGWSCFSGVDYLHPDAPLLVGIVDCGPCPAISALEAHVSREEMLWATDHDLVMAVDLPTDLEDPNRCPSIDTTVLFHIPAGAAVIMNKGTWHSPAFTLEGNARYFFLVEDKKDTIDQDAAPWIPFREGGSLTAATCSE